LFSLSRIETNFVQFCCSRTSVHPLRTTTVAQPRHEGKGIMQYLPSKLALTAPLAALLWAIPVSIDLSGPHAATADRAELIGIGLKIDRAEARVGRPATPRSVAGVARRTTRQTVRQITPYAGAAVAVPVVAGTAAVAGAAARCTTVLIRGVAVRRCGRVVY
jgi:hypothetical protein